MMFDDFDIVALDDPEFKEDAVREELIAPLIKDLGYTPTGDPKVIRGRSLIHPFVKIGSKKRKVNIIPDYLLEFSGKCLVVIDAKSPNEKIINTSHVEQAYSYAIHPEVRASIYGLCNGKEWIFWEIDKFEPILNVTTEEIKNNFSVIEKILAPEYVAFPEKRDFLPDYGLALLKAGMKDDLRLTLMENITDNIMKVHDGLYTIITSVPDGDIDYALSLDLTEEVYQKFILLCTEDIASIIKDGLSRQPYRVDKFPETTFLFQGKFGELTNGAFEDFVPLLVESIESNLI